MLGDNKRQVLYQEGGYRLYATICLFACIYIIFQLISTFHWAEWVFLSVFILVVVVAAFSKRHTLLTIGFPVILLQQSLPRGLETEYYQNWIHHSAITPFSLIYVFIFAIIVETLYTAILEKDIIEVPLTSAYFAFLIPVGIAVSTITSPTEFIYDFLILLAIPTLAVNISTVLNRSQRYTLYRLFLVVPVAIALGDLLLVFIGDVTGYRIASIYMPMATYLISVLVFMTLSYRHDSAMEWAAYAAALLSLIVVLVVGYTSTYAVIALIGAIFLSLVHIHSTGLKTRERVIYFSLATIISLFAISTILFQDISILPGVVYKITSPASLNLSEMSRSVAVRIIEFANIAIYSINNPINLAFGRGFGSYFTDAFVPFEQYFEINTNDYPMESILSGKFYSPHNTPNYVLLKYGLAGLSVIGFSIVYCVRNIISSDGIYVPPAVVFILMISWVFGWGFKNSVIMGVALGLLLTFSQGDSQTRNAD